MFRLAMTTLTGGLAAASAGTLVSDVLLTVLAPIVVMIALGVLIQAKFKLNLHTLSKLNIYLFTPAFIFDKVYRSRLPWGDMASVAGVTVAQSLILGVAVFMLGRAAKAGRETLAAMAMAVMFYNSGNYGLPLADLAYPGNGGPRDGPAIQAFVVMTMNVMTFTVGLAIAAYAGSGQWRGAARTILQMPSIYALGAALLVRLWLQGDPTRALPVLAAKPVQYLSDGLVPMALITLGAQLGDNPRWPRWRPVGAVIVLRLLVAPAWMAGMLYGLHLTGVRWLDLWPWPAELLILTAAVPTAVNTLLLTMEVKGDAALAADCVFWTTVGSCVSITAWLVLLRTAFG
jgi:hypothetical protein